MTDNTCACGKPTTAYVCNDCTDSLGRALGDVPWLIEELEVSATRQKGVDYRQAGGSGASKPTERPAPVQWGAAEARRDLAGILTEWVKFCRDEHVRSTDTRGTLPQPDPSAMSRWLLWRIDGLALHDIGPDAHTEITQAVTRCHRVIDRPADQQYLGDCPQCGGDLMGRPGAKTTRCKLCGNVEDAEAIRARLLADLDDRLYSADEIAKLSTHLGLKATRVQVRKHIEYLARNDRIAKHPSLDGTRYRFGEVYEMLIKRDYGQKAS